MLQVIVQLHSQPFPLLLLGEIQLGGQGPELLCALGDPFFEVFRQVGQGFFTSVCA